MGEFIYVYIYTNVGLPQWLMVKNSPAMQETWVQSLGWENSMEGGHDNLLQYPCLENPHGQRSLEGFSLWGRKGLDITKVTEHA